MEKGEEENKKETQVTCSKKMKCEERTGITSEASNGCALAC